MHTYKYINVIKNVLKYTYKYINVHYLNILKYMYLFMTYVKEDYKVNYTVDSFHSFLLFFLMHLEFVTP